MSLVVRTQEGGGVSAGPQHSQCLEAMFLQPGLTVVMPATPYDVKGLLKSAIRDDNPVVFIEHKGLYGTEGEVPEEEYLVPLGQAEVKRIGGALTLVAVSKNVINALLAADILQKEGISVEVVDPRTIKPLDEKTIIDSVKKTGKLLVAHEAAKFAGFGAEVAAMVAEKAMEYVEAPIVRVGALDTPVPFGPKLEECVLPNVEDLVQAARQLARYGND